MEPDWLLKTKQSSPESVNLCQSFKFFPCCVTYLSLSVLQALLIFCDRQMRKLFPLQFAKKFIWYGQIDGQAHKCETNKCSKVPIGGRIGDGIIARIQRESSIITCQISSKNWAGGNNILLVMKLQVYRTQNVHLTFKLLIEGVPTIFKMRKLY